MAKKESKKVPAKVAPKTVKKNEAPKPKGQKKPEAVKLLSFTFGATIPVQSFGNIETHLTVEAGSYEEACAYAMPKIEELYAKYAENKPKFLGKIEETVKVVAPVAAATPVAAPAPATAPKPAPVAETPAPVAEAPQEASSAPEVAQEKSPAVLKAEKAISLAMTEEAAVLIQDQIEKSVKILPEEKPDLITLVLKKRSELKAKTA